jgi:hypothetical protein
MRNSLQPLAKRLRGELQRWLIPLSGIRSRESRAASRRYDRHHEPPLSGLLQAAFREISSQYEPSGTAPKRNGIVIYRTEYAL